MTSPLGTLALGTATMLGLVVAIGAQNAFVLRQGLRREHVTAVVLVCASADAALVAAGVAGLGPLVTSSPTVVEVVRWGGAAFLVVLGVLAVRRARTAGRLVADHAAAPARAGLVPTVGTALALTYLNPHVYLDTVVLMGSVAQQHGPLRWWFGAGAVLASVAWFVAVGYGARRLAPLFARPRAWQVLDVAVAVVMVAVAVTLVA